MVGIHPVDSRAAGRIAGGLAMVLRSWPTAEDHPLSRQMHWHDARDYCKELVVLLGPDLHNMIAEPFEEGLGPTLELLWIEANSLWTGSQVGLCNSTPPDKLPEIPAGTINTLDYRGKCLAHRPGDKLVGNPYFREVDLMGVAVAAESNPPATAIAEDVGHYSVVDLMRRFNVPTAKKDACEKALERWRRDNKGECGEGWIETDGGKVTFRYRPSAVAGILAKYSEK